MSTALNPVYEKIVDGSTYEVCFESLMEMERELPKLIGRVNADHWRSKVVNRFRGRYDSWGTSQSWFGTDGGAEKCFELIRDGWPELFKALQPMIEKLRKHFALDNAAALNVEVRRRKRRQGDHGDTLDMTRVWSGQLDTAWSRPVKFPKQSASQRYCTIYVDCATSGATNAHDTIWRAAAAITMIEVLTRMGVATEVWVGTTGTTPYVSGPTRRFRSAVRVKEFAQPLNENRMATMLSCAFYRTWGFGTYMAGPWQASEGLGMISPQGMPTTLRERAEQGQRIFTIGHCLSEGEAVRCVTEVVAQLQRKEETQP